MKFMTKLKSYKTFRDQIKKNKELSKNQGPNKKEFNEKPT
jgi:hypothetical protein